MNGSVAPVFGLVALAVLCAGALNVPRAEEEPRAVDEDALPAQDTAIMIPVPTLAGSSRTDDHIFADICGCLSGRVKIRRDAPDFVPVAWSVRTLDGRLVRPRDENRSGEIVTLDMTSFEAGVYLVSLRDKSGKTITRPLNVK